MRCKSLLFVIVSNVGFIVAMESVRSNVHEQEMSSAVRRIGSMTESGPVYTRSFVDDLSLPERLYVCFVMITLCAPIFHNMFLDDVSFLQPFKPMPFDLFFISFSMGLMYYASKKYLL